MRLKTYYCTFTGADGWRGACFVRAERKGLAERVALFHGCHPGGECLTIEVPAGAPPIEPMWLNRVLDDGEVEEATGCEVVKISQRELFELRFRAWVPRIGEVH